MAETLRELVVALSLDSSNFSRNMRTINQQMNGEFPRLKPGANAFSWNGMVTRVVIRPNWRFL
jgi:phage-related protein